jgi:hypothetical protein
MGLLNFQLLHFYNALINIILPTGGRDSSVSTATRNRLDGPGFELQWGRDIPYLSRPASRPTQPPVQWVLVVFPSGKAARAWR